MTVFGKNMKLAVDRAERAAFHRVFTEGLGCTAQEPKPDLTLYHLADGFNIGVYFVDGAEALDDGAARKAPWLELCVADVDRTRQELLALGAAEIDYVDKGFHYFQAPGGLVFRIAPSSA